MVGEQTTRGGSALLTADLGTKSVRAGWDRKGVDTVAVVWPNQGGEKLMSKLAAAESVPYARGRLLLDRPASGVRVVYWPEWATLRVEGRLAAAIDGSKDSHRLATRDELRDAAAAMAGQLEQAFGERPYGKYAALSRYDLVVERDCEPVEGLALLRAMRALCPPGYKLDVVTTPDGRVETVSVVTPRRAARVFRAYDKSVESGSGPAGSRIRFEAQVVRRGKQRQTPHVVASGDLGGTFGRTIEPFLKGEAVTVTSAASVVDQLVGQVADGRMSIARAERLAGAAEFLRRFGRAVYESDHQSARRLRALRHAGIAVDDELPEGATIPVSELLTAAVAEWAGEDGR